MPPKIEDGIQLIRKTIVETTSPQTFRGKPNSNNRDMNTCKICLFFLSRTPLCGEV